MRGSGILLCAFLLAGCGSEPASRQPSEPVANQAESDRPKPAVDLTSKEGGCPFSTTRGWYAQIEGGTFSVDGQVDLMMAGYKPALKKRPGAAAGEAAFDLSLEAAPGAAVNAAAHYEEPLSEAYRKVTIYCGGKQVASFEPLDQRL